MYNNCKVSSSLSHADGFRIAFLNQEITPDNYMYLYDPLCAPNIPFQLKYLYISEIKIFLYKNAINKIKIVKIIIYLDNMYSRFKPRA